MAQDGKNRQGGKEETNSFRCCDTPSGIDRSGLRMSALGCRQGTQAAEHGSEEGNGGYKAAHPRDRGENLHSLMPPFVKYQCLK